MKNMNDSSITIAFVGDVMLGRLVNDAIRRHGPAHVWGDTLHVLLSADFRAINLECVIAESGKPWTRTPKAFHFRAEPVAIEALRYAKIDYVSIANNHSLDFGEEALIEMVELLDRANIARAGAGRNLNEARRPAILERKGFKIGVISFTDNEPIWQAGEQRPGIFYLPITTQEESFKQVSEAVKDLRASCDLIVVSAHWGPNMVEYPPPEHIAFAHAAMDAGADIFHGHSSHVFQGIEAYRGKVIFYDCGDFIDDYVVDEDLRNDESFIFLVTLTREGEREIEIVPVIINDFTFCQVNVARGRIARRIIRRMIRRSWPFGTSFKERPGGRWKVLLPVHSRER